MRDPLTALPGDAFPGTLWHSSKIGRWVNDMLQDTRNRNSVVICRYNDTKWGLTGYGVKSMPLAGNRFYEYMRYGLHVPGILVGAPLNHCEICSTVSATAATPLENKEGLIISDGNSRINNRGLVRRSRRGLLVRRWRRRWRRRGSSGRKQRRKGR